MTSTADTIIPASGEAEPRAIPKAGLSNQAAMAEWSADLTTRSDIGFHVRPATPGDEQELANFFTQVTPEDLYHRFLTGLNTVDHDRLEAMTSDDNPLSINFLAFDEPDGQIIATAMLSTDADFEIGEFALCTRSDYKHLGVSWTLLEHLVRYARAMGIKTLRSVESWDDHAALELEREMGFAVHRDPENSTLMIAEKSLLPAAP